MDGGTIKDYMLWTIIAGVSVYEIWKAIKKDKSVKKTIIFIILFIVLLWLGCNQIKRNNTDKDNAKNDIKELTKKVNTLEGLISKDSVRRVDDSLKAIKDSSNDAEFQRKLYDQFKITRDSISNKPVQATSNYNTHIGTAEKVEIGPRR